jgi:hypothetical protein
MGPDGDEDRVEATFDTLGLEIDDVVIGAETHAELLEAPEFGIEHVAWQAIARDAVAHHPAGLGAGVTDLHLVPEPRQVAGGREPARPCTDHEHAPPAAVRRRVEPPVAFQRQVTEIPLHRVDPHRAVELGAVAGALTGVVTDPAVNRGEGVLERQQPPGALVIAGLDVSEPALDVLAGRAGTVARWQQIDIHRPLGADRPGSRLPVGERGELGQVTMRAGTARGGRARCPLEVRRGRIHAPNLGSSAAPGVRDFPQPVAGTSYGFTATRARYATATPLAVRVTSTFPRVAFE